MSWEKDSALNRLAEEFNVAQFISYGPNDPSVPRYSRVLGNPPNYAFASIEEGLTKLFEASRDQLVNVRSFRPEQTKGAKFVYGIDTPSRTIDEVRQLIDSGWYVIVNETIDVKDGGVSGVVLGDVIEFAPGDTPRCVEKPGTCRLPRKFGTRLLERVYGFQPELTCDYNERLEFSLHPRRCGFRREHTILWEIESCEAVRAEVPRIRWPNLFSQLIGDKTFGLLIADQLGADVPRTIVIGRSIAPFSFGQRTATSEFWLRTAPSRQNPGKYTTTFGWADPFATMARDESSSEQSSSTWEISSVLSQESVDSQYSGGAACTDRESIIVEGVAGYGSKFMLGTATRDELPAQIEAIVAEMVRKIELKVGPVRLEWAYDGHRPWVLQLHCGAVCGLVDTIVPGTPERWIDFEIVKGLHELRDIVRDIEPAVGIRLFGDIGVTSHFGDLLRARAIPSCIVRPSS